MHLHDNKPSISGTTHWIGYIPRIDKILQQSVVNIIYAFISLENTIGIYTPFSGALMEQG